MEKNRNIFSEKGAGGGGGQGPFGNFPEIHPFSYAQASLRANIQNTASSICLSGLLVLPD